MFTNHSDIIISSAFRLINSPTENPYISRLRCWLISPPVSSVSSLPYPTLPCFSGFHTVPLSLLPCSSPLPSLLLVLSQRAACRAPLPCNNTMRPFLFSFSFRLFCLFFFFFLIYRRQKFGNAAAAADPRRGITENQQPAAVVRRRRDRGASARISLRI